jgi:uncharacterized membrane protein YeaQ/YmgE (transglycosylase-associated protein family)
MGVFAWVVIGVLVAWIAGSLPSSRGSPPARTPILGILGARLGGALASLADLSSGRSLFNAGARVLASPAPLRSW